MENIEYLNVEEVKPQGQFLKAIGFKPKAAPLICIAVGIAMIAVLNIYTIILGVFFAGMGILVLALVKDYKVLDIFDKGIMLYEGEEAKKACFIPYDDIKMWSVRHENGSDIIEFELNDGTKITRVSFEASKVYRTLINLIKEKEDRYLKIQKERKISSSIPDIVNNLRDRFMKK